MNELAELQDELEETEVLDTPLKLIIPVAVYRKIMAYVTICDTEISGFAEIEYNPDRKALIAGDSYLLEQTAGGADVHMDEETVSKFNLQRIKAGAEQLPRLWWHSHVNMEAFFSGIDEGTLKDLQNDSFIVALVLNKHKEMKAKAYIYAKIETTIMGITEQEEKWLEIDPLPISVEFDYERIPESLKKEVEKKVKTRVYEAPATLPFFKKNPFIIPGVKTDDQLRRESKARKYAAGVAKVQFLPKKIEDAENRIANQKLEREWSFEYDEWVYRNPNTGETWVDYWDCISVYDYEAEKARKN